jgi:hypothetical protein
MSGNLETDARQTPLSVASTSRVSTSGLTLVLPSLSALKQQNGAGRAKRTGKTPSRAQSLGDGLGEVKKTPRLVKLKPLKEVLSKLISQIKKYSLPPRCPVRSLTACYTLGKMTMHSSCHQWTNQRSQAIRTLLHSLWTLGQ